MVRLRAQTHLAPLVGQERRGNKRKRAGETQRWRSDSVVYAGFQRLGGLQSDKVRTSHGSLDAAAAVALSFSARQSDNITKVVKSLRMRKQRGNEAEWIWFHRSWDGTPKHVRFGALKPFCVPLSRLVARRHVQRQAVDCCWSLAFD